MSILFVVFGFQLWPDSLKHINASDAACLFLLSLFLFIAAYEIIFVKIHRADDNGLDFSQNFSFQDLKTMDFFYKTVGLMAPFLAALFFYWIFDLYDSDFYDPFFEVLKKYGFYVVAALLVYFTIIHHYMRNARDIYWHVGAFLVSRGRQGDISQVRNHALSVLVKAFFIPLMFCFFVND